MKEQRETERGYSSYTSVRILVDDAQRRLNAHAFQPCVTPSDPITVSDTSTVMNSPLEPASPASSSTESLTDDVPMTQEYSGSSAHDRSERPGFLANSLAFAKNVAKRRLPGGSSKTTSNRDSKARRREEGSQRKGGLSDRRDPDKGKDDLLDVALFEHLKKSTVILFYGVLFSLPIRFLRNSRPSQRRYDQARWLSATATTCEH